MSSYFLSSATISSFSSISSSSSFSSFPSVTGTIPSNATRTTHIPLTTIFTPPPGCEKLPYTFSAEQSGISIFHRDAQGLEGGLHRLCYPSGFQYQYWSGFSAEFSPGACPHGYTGALVEQHTEDRGAITSYCCPVGMSYAQSIGCITTITTSTTVVMDPSTTVTMTTPFIAADWDIKVVWAYSQLNVFTPASAPLLRRVSLGSATPTNNVTTQGRPPKGAQMERDFSAGQMVGIGAGVLFFVVAVFASGVYALWRRKRNRPWVGDTSALIENQPMEEKTVASSSGDAQTQNKLAQVQQTSQNADPNEYQRMSEDDSLSIRAALHGGWQAHQDTGNGTSRG